MNNIYYDNDIDLFDKKLIFFIPLDINNFIYNKIPEENVLTFALIDNKEKLIIHIIILVYLKMLAFLIFVILMIIY